MMHSLLGSAVISGVLDIVEFIPPSPGGTRRVLDAKRTGPKDDLPKVLSRQLRRQGMRLAVKGRTL